MARASVAAGADGLLIEVHPNPDRAWSDGAQSLNGEQFVDMMKQLRRIADAVDRQLAGSAAGGVNVRPLLAALALSAAGQAYAQNTAADPLDRAATTYTSRRTLRATFKQTLTSPATRTVRNATGEFFQEGPRFALRFSDPAGDAIVSDGSAIWVFLPSTSKGTVMKVPRQLGAGLGVMSQLLSKPREHYAVTQLPDTVIGSTQWPYIHLRRAAATFHLRALPCGSAATMPCSGSWKQRRPAG